ncbi:MAG: hypothetical protein ABEL76_05590 [Bradymonadaceae bacterium]
MAETDQIQRKIVACLLALGFASNCSDAMHERVRSGADPQRATDEPGEAGVEPAERETARAEPAGDDYGTEPARRGPRSNPPPGQFVEVDSPPVAAEVVLQAGTKRGVFTRVSGDADTPRRYRPLLRLDAQRAVTEWERSSLNNDHGPEAPRIYDTARMAGATYVATRRGVKVWKSGHWRSRSPEGEIRQIAGAAGRLYAAVDCALVSGQYRNSAFDLDVGCEGGEKVVLVSENRTEGWTVATPAVDAYQIRDLVAARAGVTVVTGDYGRHWFSFDLDGPRTRRSGTFERTRSEFAAVGSTAQGNYRCFAFEQNQPAFHVASGPAPCTDWSRRSEVLPAPVVDTVVSRSTLYAVTEDGDVGVLRGRGDDLRWTSLPRFMPYAVRPSRGGALVASEGYLFFATARSGVWRYNPAAEEWRTVTPERAVRPPKKRVDVVGDELWYFSNLSFRADVDRRGWRSVDIHPDEAPSQPPGSVTAAASTPTSTYVGTERGALYRSGNGSDGWTRLAADFGRLIDGGYRRGSDRWPVRFVRADGDHIVVAMGTTRAIGRTDWEQATPIKAPVHPLGGGLFATTNGGQSWETFHGGLPERKSLGAAQLDREPRTGLPAAEQLVVVRGAALAVPDVKRDRFGESGSREEEPGEVYRRSLGADVWRSIDGKLRRAAGELDPSAEGVRVDLLAEGKRAFVVLTREKSYRVEEKTEILVSEDGGRSWSARSATLPERVRSATVDEYAVDGGAVYALVGRSYTGDAKVELDLYRFGLDTREWDRLSRGPLSFDTIEDYRAFTLEVSDRDAWVTGSVAGRGDLWRIRTD